MATAIAGRRTGKRRAIVALATIVTALLVALVGAPAASGTPGTDDYPFRADAWCATWVGQYGTPPAQPTVSNCTSQYTDGWGFYKRECTSFVTWRMRNENGFAGFKNTMTGPNNQTRTLGSAGNWGTAASQMGYVVDMNPVAGAVAWLSSGHVAWVRSVSGSDVTIEEYNWNFTHNYSATNRVILAGSVSGYIHFLDLPASQPPISAQPPRVGSLDANHALQIKEGAIGASWQQVAASVDEFRLSPSRIGILQGSSLLVKEGPLGATWVTVATGVEAFSLTDSRIAIRSGAVLSIKEGPLNAPWTQVATGVAGFDISPNRLGIVDANGNLSVKEGPLNAPWTFVANNVTKFHLTDSRVGVLWGTDFYVKDGSLGATWTLIVNPTSDFQLTGNRIVARQVNGELLVKEGAIGTPWTMVSGATDGYAVSDARIAIWTGGNLSVKDDSIGAPWTLVMNGVLTSKLS